MLTLLLILIVVALTVPMSATAKTVLNIAMWVVLILFLLGAYFVDFPLLIHIGK